MSYKGRNIVNDYDTKYQHAYAAWNAYLPAAEEDLRYFLGDQWTTVEKQALYDQNRSAFVVNRIKPNINMVTGYQRKHRLSSVVVPTEPQDQSLTDQLTQLLLYVFQYGDFYETISDAFEGALITGWNMLSLWMDYRSDPLGQICLSREPYNAFITDPYFSKRDLSDCSYVLRRKYISLDQAKALLPKDKREMAELYKKGPLKDDKFTWLPYQRNPSGQTMLAYDEYWEQGFEKKQVMFDLSTGDEYEFNGDESVVYGSEELMILEKEEPYVLQHIIVNGNHITTEKNPYGLNEYPFIPVFCQFSPESDQWSLKIQSLVRTMKDPQKIGNQRRSQIIDIIESQINSGWIAEDGSVINPRALYQTGQGKVVWKKKGADPSSLQRLDPAQVSPSLFQAKESFDQDIQFSAGITDELLGADNTAGDSGLKVALRQGAALVGLQGPFDQLRLSQKLLTRKTIKLIGNWSDTKLKSVLNAEPDPRITSQTKIKYDIAVQEGTLTSTQQQMFFQQLLTLKELGEPIPPGLISQAAPLQGKTEYKTAMEQFAQQQQQAAEVQNQMQQQILQSQQQLVSAEAASDTALAHERIAKAHSEVSLQEERRAKAVDDRSSAVLNRIESLLKLQELDEKSIDRLIARIEKLNELTKQEEVELPGAESSGQVPQENQQPEVISGQQE